MHSSAVVNSYFSKTRIFGNHRRLSMFIDVYLCFFIFLHCLGKVVGCLAFASSWILVTLGVRQLQTSKYTKISKVLVTGQMAVD